MGKSSSRAVRMPVLSEVCNAPVFSVEFSAATAEISRANGQTTFCLPLPWLEGDLTEILFRDAQPAGEAHGFLLYQSGGLTIGCAVQPVDGNPATAARELYRRLLRASAGQSLYRIWNYVPEINARLEGIENYRAFCAGRSHAFEEAYGANFKQLLPAASAVGCTGRHLAVIFVAGHATPRYVENPEQVAAYLYPPEHGVRSPSFSRATVTTDAGRPLVFISGTAAIKGHTTVGIGSLAEQLECTLDNLQILSRGVGFGESFAADREVSRHFKIYLRHAADLPAVRAKVERDLVQPGDQVIYVQADICRAELLVEIEATLMG